MLSVTFPVGWRNGNMFPRNLCTMKFIQSSTKKVKFDHSLTVTPAVRHGKLNVLRYSKDLTTL